MRADAHTYELSGTGLETVVLLHGEFSDASAWQRTIDALTPKYRVLTYVRSEWGNNASAITPEQVAAIHTKEGDHKAWTQDELLKLP